MTKCPCRWSEGSPNIICRKEVYPLSSQALVSPWKEDLKECAMCPQANLCFVCSQCLLSNYWTMGTVLLDPEDTTPACRSEWVWVNWFLCSLSWLERLAISVVCLFSTTITTITAALLHILGQINAALQSPQSPHIRYAEKYTPL